MFITPSIFLKWLTAYKIVFTFFIFWKLKTTHTKYSNVECIKSFNTALNFGVFIQSSVKEVFFFFMFEIIFTFPLGNLEILLNKSSYECMQRFLSIYNTVFSGIPVIRLQEVAKMLCAFKKFTMS